MHVFRIRINSIEVTFIVLTIPVIYFSIRSLCASTIKGNPCKVVNTKCVYRLLYSTFINKVIRFDGIGFVLSTEVFFFKNKVFLRH